MPFSSASSLRIAAELLAQQELPLLLVHALLDVLADGLGDVELGQVLPAPGRAACAAARRRRRSPAARPSARWSGSRRSRPGRPAPTGRSSTAPSRRTGTRRAAAGSWSRSTCIPWPARAARRPARSGSGSSVASTQSAAPGPVVPVPIRARSVPRTTAACSPPRSRPTCSITPTRAEAGVLAVQPGHQQHLGAGVGVGRRPARPRPRPAPRSRTSAPGPPCRAAPPRRPAEASEAPTSQRSQQTQPFSSSLAMAQRNLSRTHSTSVATALFPAGRSLSASSSRTGVASAAPARERIVGCAVKHGWSSSTAVRAPASRRWPALADQRREAPSAGQR